MQTYKYRFKTSGSIDDTSTFFISMLENKLKDGPDCLMAYCIFPTDSDILDHVSIDMDKEKNIKAINLHTYTELWTGMESDLRNCVEENLAAITPNIKIEDDVEALGREGKVPKILYHIADKKDLDSIMKKGLIPGQGNNGYKSDEDYVYLASEKDLASWLSVLKNVDDPVILKIDTDSMADSQEIEMGRMFHDRSFIPEGYTEYRTTKTVPASAIKEVDFKKGNDELSKKLEIDMIYQLTDVRSDNEFNEVTTGMNRLVDLGIMHKDVVNTMITAYREEYMSESKVSESEKPDIEDDGPPWDEDDFTKAIDEMSYTQMTLSDYGIK